MTEPTPGPVIPKEFELLTMEGRQKIVEKLKQIPKDQIEKFVYKNKRGEWALTYEATKWLVREMADKGEAIRIDGHPKVERCIQDPEWMTCTVLGKRVKVDREGKCEMLLDTNVGSARSWIKQQKTSGEVYPDEFWFSKVVSRATRNLQQSMIPTDFKRTVITRLVELKNGVPANGRTAQGPQQPQRSQAAPAQGTSQGQAQPSQNQQRQQGSASQGQQSRSPQQGQQDPQQGQQSRPPQNQQSRSPSQGQAPKNPNDAPLETVQQGFNAVLTQFSGTNDRATIAKILKTLTGKSQVTELERELMIELGPLLRRKIKGELKWTGTGLFVISTGEQLWPKNPPQPEPPLDEPPQEEGPPPPGDDQVPMF